MRTEGIMGGASGNVSGPVAIEKIGASDEGRGDESIASTRSISSRNGWSTVPIQAVPPASQTEGAVHTQNGQQQDQHQYHPYQPQPQQQAPQQPHSPSSTRVASHSAQQQQQQPPVKADTSYLPLFPVAPHPDNGFGPERHSAEGASEVASPYTNAPSSAGMWQSSAGKSPAATNAAATESPLIEF